MGVRYLPLDLVDGVLRVLNVRSERGRHATWVLEDDHPVSDKGHESERRESGDVSETGRRGQAEPLVDHHEHGGEVDVRHRREHEHDRQRHVAPHPARLPLGYLSLSPPPVSSPSS